MVFLKFSRQVRKREHANIIAVNTVIMTGV